MGTLMKNTDYYTVKNFLMLLDDKEQMYLQEKLQELKQEGKLGERKLKELQEAVEAEGKRREVEDKKSHDFDKYGRCQYCGVKMDMTPAGCSFSFSSDSVRKPKVVFTADRRQVGDSYLDGDIEMLSGHPMCSKCQERLYQEVLDGIKNFIDDSLAFKRDLSFSK